MYQKYIYGAERCIYNIIIFHTKMATNSTSCSSSIEYQVHLMHKKELNCIALRDIFVDIIIYWQYSQLIVALPTFIK